MKSFVLGLCVRRGEPWPRPYCNLLKHIIPCSATFDPEAFIEQGALDVLNVVVHLGTVGQSAGSAWIL